MSTTTTTTTTVIDCCGKLTPAASDAQTTAFVRLVAHLTRKHSSSSLERRRWALRLRNNFLRTAAVPPLLHVLLPLVGLVELDLSHNALDDSCAHTLCCALAGHPHLTSLDLSHNAFHHVQELGRLLVENNACVGALTNLDLSHNLLGGLTVVHLAGCIARNGRISHLRFASTMIHDSDLAAVADALLLADDASTVEAGGHHHPYVLDVSYNSLYGTDIAATLHTLAQVRGGGGVTALNLAGNHLGPRQIAEIGAALADLRCSSSGGLRHIDISCNVDRTMMRTRTAMDQSVAEVVFGLAAAHCGRSDGDGVKLALRSMSVCQRTLHELMQFRNLLELDLSDNALAAPPRGDSRLLNQFLSALCGPLCGPTLQRLALRNNHFGERQYRLLVVSVARSTHLQTLDLDGNHVIYYHRQQRYASMALWRLVADCLITRNNSLTTLDLSFLCDFQAEGSAVLIDAMRLKRLLPFTQLKGLEMRYFAHSRLFQDDPEAMARLRRIHAAKQVFPGSTYTAFSNTDVLRVKRSRDLERIAVIERQLCPQLAGQRRLLQLPYEILLHQILPFI